MFFFSSFFPKEGRRTAGVLFRTSWLRFPWPGKMAGKMLTPRERAGPGLPLRLLKKIKTRERTGVPEIGPSLKIVQKKTTVPARPGRGQPCGGAGTRPGHGSSRPGPAGFTVTLFTNGRLRLRGQTPRVEQGAARGAKPRVTFQDLADPLPRKAGHGNNRDKNDKMK